MDQQEVHMSQIRDLRAVEASAYLRDAWNVKHSASYLAWLRCRGGGPRFYLVGRAPHYTTADLDLYGRNKTGPVVSTTAEHRALTGNAA
jgi:hypothetical protein